ncbi:response regulator transcription factor [Pseudonocardia xishanensis]|uniref:Response regulator transcription factor n=1 Tax=Pseudonocardia xishanensis TaxID=630995 RepID=A0ABP8RDY2_9PSEU
MDVLVLTSAHDGRVVLPGLDLLPHRVSTRRPTVAEYLASDPCDAVLVDGRTHPSAARELSRRLVATTRGFPVIGVIDETAAPHVDGDWAIVQLVLSGAGPAEIDARLRLAQRHRSAEPEQRPSVLGVGPFTIDAQTYTISLDGRPLPLTHHQFELLKALLVHAGRPLSRADLIAECAGWTDDTSPRAVDCHVRAVRAKLGPHRDAIRTVRGHGYLIPWSPPVRPPTP